MMSMKKTPKKIVKKAPKKMMKKVPLKAAKSTTKIVSGRQSQFGQKAKAPVVTKSFNRAQIVRYLAATSKLPKKYVLSVMDALNELIAAHLRKRGPGEFTLLGLAKFRVIHKSAVKARAGVNPFTGKPAIFAAKPARQVVKIRPLKKIKEMAK